MDRPADRAPTDEQKGAADYAPSDGPMIMPGASSPSLAEFAAQLTDIAAQLSEVAANQHSDAPPPATANSAANAKQVSSLALARHAYGLRRQRGAIFGSDELFGEPAWDILLDLYIAHAQGTPVSVSSACIGSASPPTTGLRWLSVLAQKGLVNRENDPADHRRIMVRLTEQGVSALEQFFDLARQMR